MRALEYSAGFFADSLQGALGILLQGISATRQEQQDLGRGKGRTGPQPFWGCPIGGTSNWSVAPGGTCDCRAGFPSMARVHWQGVREALDALDA